VRKQKRETVNLGLSGKAQIMNLHVSCDWCLRQKKARPARFVTRATGTLFDDAARWGWRCTRAGEDVCPKCLAEAGEPPVLKPEPMQRELFDGPEGSTT
jgi:hypothetical protein